MKMCKIENVSWYSRVQGGSKMSDIIIKKIGVSYEHYYILITLHTF